MIERLFVVRGGGGRGMGFEWGGGSQRERERVENIDRAQVYEEARATIEILM